MKMSNEHCKRLLSLEMRRAEGLTIGQEDEAFRAAHLAACSDCRLETASLNALGNPESAGTLAELDELARRRLVDDVIAQAANLPPLSADGTSDTVSARTPIRWRALALTATLAAASIAAVLVWTRPIQPPEQAPSSPIPAPRIALATGELVLLAGDVKVDGQDAVIGDRIRVGERFQTGAGRAVVTLPAKVTVSLGPKTSAVWNQEDGAASEVVLHSGEIHLSVAPDIERRAGFAVVTPRGRIEVTGTVFSVVASPKSVEVRVLRGEVEIADRGGRARRLGTRAATSLGSTRIWTLSKKEEQTLWEQVRAIALLHSEDRTVVDVRSEPNGATVTIDSVEMGSTPVTASVRAGYRELVVASGSRQVERKLVDLRPGAHFTWNFDLSETASEATSETAATATATRASATGSKPLKPVATSSAQELLAAAQSLRAAQNWPGAAQTYRQLIASYPGSGEARASLVSLGGIELGKLSSPAAALGHFDTYLASNSRGPLAQEALLNKARALGQLGRTGDEIATLNSFLERFPSAIQTRKVRQRLAEIAK